MNKTILEQDLTELLGLDALPEEEKIALLRDVGQIVMDASLLRLTAELSDEQVSALEQYLETEPEAEVLMQHLMEHHKNFETILKEEMAAMKEETVAVLGGVK